MNYLDQFNKIRMEASNQCWKVFIDWLSSIEGITVNHGLFKKLIESNDTTLFPTCLVERTKLYTPTSLIQYKGVNIDVSLRINGQYNCVKIAFPQIACHVYREHEYTGYISKPDGSQEYEYGLKMLEKKYPVSLLKLHSLERANLNTQLTKDQALDCFARLYTNNILLNSVWYLNNDSREGLKRTLDQKLKRYNALSSMEELTKTRIYKRYLANRWPKIQEIAKLQTAQDKEKELVRNEIGILKEIPKSIKDKLAKISGYKKKVEEPLHIKLDRELAAPFNK
jgi:hypothetical protein